MTMTEKQKEELKKQVFYSANMAMIGLIEGEAHNPKGMALDAVAEAALEQGLILVKKFNDTPFQTRLAKQLAEL